MIARGCIARICAGVGDHGNARIRRVDQAGLITTVAGNGEDSGPTDGDRATASPLGRPEGIAVEVDGTVIAVVPDSKTVRSIVANQRIGTLYFCDGTIPRIWRAKVAP